MDLGNNYEWMLTSQKENQGKFKCYKRYCSCRDSANFSCIDAPCVPRSPWLISSVLKMLILVIFALFIVDLWRDELRSLFHCFHRCCSDLFIFKTFFVQTFHSKGSTKSPQTYEEMLSLNYEIMSNTVYKPLPWNNDCNLILT